MFHFTPISTASTGGHHFSWKCWRNTVHSRGILFGGNTHSASVWKVYMYAYAFFHVFVLYVYGVCPGSVHMWVMRVCVSVHVWGWTVRVVCTSKYNCSASLRLHALLVPMTWHLCTASLSAFPSAGSATLLCTSSLAVLPRAECAVSLSISLLSVFSSTDAATSPSISFSDIRSADAARGLSLSSFSIFPRAECAIPSSIFSFPVLPSADGAHQLSIFSLSTFPRA